MRKFHLFSNFTVISRICKNLPDYQPDHQSLNKKEYIKQLIIIKQQVVIIVELFK